MPFRKNVIKIIRSFIITALFFTAGCAYYNTFFNARQFFKKAEYESNRSMSPGLTGPARTYYERTVDKCLKILEIYSNSRYVDDALFLLGKSYYALGEIGLSERRFQELLLKYPFSPLTNETRLWLARIDGELNRHAEAEKRLEGLLLAHIPRDLKSRVHYAVAELKESQGDRAGAVAAYQMSYQTGLKENRDQALFSAAAHMDTLGRFTESAILYQRAERYASSHEFRIECRLREARSRRLSADYQQSMNLLRNLSADEAARNRKAEIELETAALKMDMEEWESAIEDYGQIIEDYSNTAQAAEAAYRLARYYELSRGNYARALELYEKVSAQGRRSVFADSAETYKKTIQRWQALQQVVRLGRAARDSTDSAADTTGAETIESSNDRASESRTNGAADTESDRENPELKNLDPKALEENLFLLAELYWRQWNRPDSAAALFQELSRMSVNEMAHKAVLAWAWMERTYNGQSADSLLTHLIQSAPESIYADQARHMLNLPVEESLPDSTEIIYRMAENHRLQGRYRESVRFLKEALSSPAGMDRRAEILYAMAWTYERMDSLDTARALYDTLSSRYSETPFGASARLKIEEVSKALIPADSTAAAADSAKAQSETGGVQKRKNEK
ncbi:MAG TPA: tetratricopeptide repeat protein [bacterium]|nr:tetratricopeptide repeat protein [bacterium]